MSLKVCVLASGSQGNCTFIATSSTRILIDAGLSGRRTIERLAQLRVAVEEIDAILVGHEHADHVRGLPALAGKYARPVYLNRATADAAVAALEKAATVRIFTNGQSWEIGDLTVLPFSVFHDAQDPVGFVIRQGPHAVTVATDLGTPTRLVRERLRGSRVVILEANHDPALLMNGNRPWSLKQRIKSSQGHLSNEDAADLLAEETDASLTDIFLAHLSRDCNCPESARRVVTERLRKAGKPAVRVRLTYPDRISDVVEVGDEPTSDSMVQDSVPTVRQLGLNF
ncbi:MAG: MBL fold metallo-hydrolase [PVC group bacterium]